MMNEEDKVEEQAPDAAAASATTRDGNVRRVSLRDALNALGCLAVVGLLAGVLAVLVQIRDAGGIATTGGASSSATSPTSGGHRGGPKTPREFLGSLDDVLRVCGGGVGGGSSQRQTVETSRQMYLWNATVRETLCCDDWSDSECHILGLKCAECNDYGNGNDGDFTVTGECSDESLSVVCGQVWGQTLPDLTKDCKGAGGTVAAFEEPILHRRKDYEDSKPKEQLGLVARCSTSQGEVDDVLGFVVCGSCEDSTYGTGLSNYVEREDCRALTLTYPTCGGGSTGNYNGAPMVTSADVQDLLKLCGADEVGYMATRVHPRKYGDGNEIELYAHCSTIGDYSMIPFYGVACGHCDGKNQTFVPSGRCGGIDPEILKGASKCYDYMPQTNLTAACREGDGVNAQMGFVGEYGGNLTKAMLLCCGSSDNCAGGSEYSGLFCGECVGEGWREYVPYRNCSGALGQGSDEWLFTCE